VAKWAGILGFGITKLKIAKLRLLNLRSLKVEPRDEISCGLVPAKVQILSPALFFRRL